MQQNRNVGTKISKDREKADIKCISHKFTMWLSIFQKQRWKQFAKKYYRNSDSHWKQPLTDNILHNDSFPIPSNNKSITDTRSTYVQTDI